MVIEDACHALGSRYEYKKKMYSVGGDGNFECSVFSFHPLKTITSGEGGAAVFKKTSPYKKSRLLRSHGIVKKNHWDYDVILKGYNYRMDEISATLGNSQLTFISKIINKRRNLSLLYNKFLKNNSDFISILYSDFEIKNSACHLYQIRVFFDKLKIDKSKLINIFLKKNILLHSHYKPISHFSYVKLNHSQNFNIVNSKEYFDNSITLPLYYEMTYSNVERICKLLISFINSSKIRNAK